MSRKDDGLTVEIHDDGIGVAAENNPSRVGLASMTERATELGGGCTNEDSPRGGGRGCMTMSDVRMCARAQGRALQYVNTASLPI